MTNLSYALITPARDERENIRRLADSLLGQTVRPDLWLVVDNGSTDGTGSLVAELAEEHAWISLLDAPAGDGSEARGAPIVRAFVAGLATLPSLPDLVVKLDADVSFEHDYFERLLAEFDLDPTLGIASGACYELRGGEWQEDRGAREHVRGATRVYRRECLADVMPLEERMGWDGIDELKANVHGWTTRRFRSFGFYHHRPLGKRERSRWGKWVRQGDLAHYMGYRFTYLIFRVLFRLREDIFAPAMLWGFLAAGLSRRPRCPDPAVREYLRRQQRLRELPQRLREVFVSPSTRPADDPSLQRST